MKRITLALAMAAFLLLAFTHHSAGVSLVSAQGSGYTVENIDHQIEVTYSGNIIIRDTVTVNGQIIGGFSIGFPYKYSSYVLKGVAFTSKESLPLSLDVQLGDRTGFYGAEVAFPSGSPKTFTVVFVLSNALLTSYSGGFYLDFPAYPSLAQEVSRCNVTIVLPKDASIVDVEKDDGIVRSGKFEKTNLAAFSYFPANATISASEGVIRQVVVESLNRVVTLGIAGEIAVSDNYRVINNSTGQITSLKLDLPSEASNIVVKDESGTPFSSENSTSEVAGVASLKVNFPAPLRSGQSVTIKVEYSLPSVSIEQTRFTLGLQLFPYFSYYINTFSITVIPPEGARIVVPPLPPRNSLLTLDREIYQETLRIDMGSMSYVDHYVNAEESMQIIYEYNSIWVSLRPAFWVWGLAAVGSILLIFMRRPRSKPPKPQKLQVPKLATGKLGSERIKAFVDAYEEKARLSAEVKTLTHRVNKGKMPRRQYKVQRRALELRISALSKTLAELKPAFNAAGGNYADLIRQLDVAESEAKSIEKNLGITEARYQTGELLLEDYKKSLSEMKQRKEKVEARVNGILLRLREEIR